MSWECVSCTYVNAGGNATCHVCGQPADSDGFLPAKSKRRNEKPEAAGPSSAHQQPQPLLAPAAIEKARAASVATASPRLAAPPLQKAQAEKRNPISPSASSAAAPAAKNGPPRAWGPAGLPGLVTTPPASSLLAHVSSHSSAASSTSSTTPTSLHHQQAPPPQQQQQQGRPRRDPRLGPNADEDERRATDEGRKVFVGNLKRPITRPEVVAHFEKFGPVERVILNSGFGLVLMATREGAEAATQQRWQALDWRNVEVFLYEKGQKGASWTRPGHDAAPQPLSTAAGGAASSALPSALGATAHSGSSSGTTGGKKTECATCKSQAAEHCAVCSNMLCAQTTCSTRCDTCERVFCLQANTCAKSMLDSCDTCHARACPFCLLKPESACSKCRSPPSAALVGRIKAACEKFVKSHIGENDGAVYGLVCALKGDSESAREAQLVAAIDRASKCLDPSSNRFAAEAAQRAVRELEEAWESTKRVHNLRALRRSAKQWTADLSGHSRAALSSSNAAAAAAAAAASLAAAPSASAASAATATTTVASPPSPRPSAQAYEAFVTAIRAADYFLGEFMPRSKADVDALSANVRASVAALKRQVRLADEFADRVEVWGNLLRQHCSAPPVVAPAAAGPLSSVDRLKLAVQEAEHVYFGSKTFEEFMASKERCVTELMRVAREVKLGAQGAGAVASANIKAAARLARHLEMRVVQWPKMASLRLPFNACYHYFVSRFCRRPRGCPFLHGERPDHAADDAAGDDVEAILCECDEDDFVLSSPQSSQANTPLQSNTPRGSFLQMLSLSPTITSGGAWNDKSSSPGSNPAMSPQPQRPAPGLPVPSGALSPTGGASMLGMWDRPQVSAWDTRVTAGPQSPPLALSPQQQHQHALPTAAAVPTMSSSSAPHTPSSSVRLGPAAQAGWGPPRGTPFQTGQPPLTYGSSMPAYGPPGLSHNAPAFHPQQQPGPPHLQPLPSLQGSQFAHAGGGGGGGGAWDRFNVRQQSPSSAAGGGPASSLNVDMNLFLQVSALCREAGLDEYVTVIASAFQSAGAAVLRLIQDVDVTLLHRELTRKDIPPAVRIKVMNVVNQRREQQPGVYVPPLF